MENIRELIKYSGFLGGSAGSGGTGGAQPDLNAAPGEPGHVLNRTHWSEIVEGVLLPETTVEIDPDQGASVLLEPVLDLVVGEEYTVTWNGVEYETVGLDGAAMGEAGVVLGNVGLMLGGEDTGEPFILMAISPERVADVGFAIMVAALDGSTSATVSLSGVVETVHKLAGKYLPVGTPYVESKPYSFPETAGIPLDPSVFAIASKIELTEGNTYTVTYNGVEYECKCGFASIDGMTGLYLGNGMLVGDADNVTDAPFAIISLFKPVEGMWGLIFDLNAPTTAVFSISGTFDAVHRMDERCLPEDLGVKMFFATTGDGSHPTDSVDNVTFLFTYEDLKKVYKQGKSAVIRIQHSAEDFSDFHLNGCQNGKLIFSIAHSKAIYTLYFDSDGVEIEKNTF